MPIRSSAGWEEKQEHDRGGARGSGRGWRAEKEIERGSGEACARDSIAAAARRRKTSAGEASLSAGFHWRRGIASESRMGKLASDDSGMASVEK